MTKLFRNSLLTVALMTVAILATACSSDGLNEEDVSRIVRDINATKAAETPPESTVAQTNTPTPDATSTPKADPTTRPSITGNADVRGMVNTFTNAGGWEITTYEGVTDQMVQWFQNLRGLDPAKWPTFPNVPNPHVPDFRVVECKELDPNAKTGEKCVPDGMYYGLDERNYCDNDICDVLVQARGYNNITGDYDLGFVRHSMGDDGLGSALLLINVGDVTANFEDVHVDNGFSVADRYFNGDTLWWGMWGITSHTTAAMMNYPIIADATTGRVLNSGGSGVNAGANCSVPQGCEGVHYTIVISSGNHVLVVATTTFTR